MAFEKIDEGVVDALTALIEKITDFSELKEPDIKTRLELERTVSKQFRIPVGNAHKFLNFTLSCMNHQLHRTNDQHRSQEKKY
jgi:hypothetical protein